MKVRVNNNLEHRLAIFLLKQVSDDLFEGTESQVEFWRQEVARKKAEAIAEALRGA